jgi:histidinol-phosphate/aromatic aminotransferase/cobyric acid decarboxylase-like protein
MIYSPRWKHLYEIERTRIPPTPEGDLRLQRLERPEAWPDELWPRADKINLYPNYPPLIKRLSVFCGVPPEQIVLGLGIEDFIRTLVFLCCEPGDGFAFTWPTCAMFEIYGKVFQTRTYKIIAHPQVFPPASHIASYASEVKLILLPNPGQPVESCYGLNDLRTIASACRQCDTVFAVDEAYFGFGGPSALPLIDEFDNVVVLRTFSKAFGGAGLRVGYAMGQPKVIRPLNAIRLSGEITGPSIRAASRLLANWADVVEPGIREVMAGRDWLRERLIEDGFKASGQLANHVLLELQSVGEMRRIVDGLLSLGVHVKGNYPAPLDKHVLITAGSPALMRTFYERFIEVAAKKEESYA